MATQAATLPAVSAPAPTASRSLRTRFGCGKSSVSTARKAAGGVIASPLLFWVVIGARFGTSSRSGMPPDKAIISIIYPGALIMIVLFTSIFTMMSVIEDRKEGFCCRSWSRPSRVPPVLGKVLGGTTLAAYKD